MSEPFVITEELTTDSNLKWQNEECLPPKTVVGKLETNYQTTGHLIANERK